MGTYTDIESHRGMIFDEVRNRAYSKAISQVVTPTSRVLDLGAGLGIHGLMAAIAGAGEVILLDSSPVVELAKKLSQANGVYDRVKIIHKRVEDAEINDPVDVIISVFTGNFLLAEDLLPSLFVARDRFLKPGGVMLPARARMRASLVSAQAFHDRRVASWSEPTLGILYEPVRQYAANGIFFDKADSINAKFLSSPETLQELDLMTAVEAGCHNTIELMVHSSGTCHGILGWFDILLGSEWLSTSPDTEPTHWSPAFMPLDPPIEMFSGDKVQLDLDRPEFGEWTWTVSCRTGHQRHSTFLGTPANLGFLKKQQDSRVPGLGAQGEIALFVLNQMKLGKSLSEILEGARLSFQRHWKFDPGLSCRIRNMVNQWGGDE